MPAVFISYRRSDSQDITGRIFDRLVGHYGSKPVKVIRDVDSFPVGEDFRDVLRDKIEECDVVLVIIGPTWSSVKDGKGNRRIEDAADTVRIEIEQALELKKKVIPVCVTHAMMPGEDELPPALQKLAFRNGVQVRPDPDFHTDITRLLGALDKIFKDKMVAEAKRPTAPPPQRQVPLPPEPPPPPVIAPYTRATTPYQESPVHAEAASPSQPFQPPNRSGDSFGQWPRSPAASSSSTSQSASPSSQPQVRPLAPTKPKVSLGVFASSTGVAILLTGLVTMCMCGGGFCFLCISLAGRGYVQEITEDIKNRPAIIEHLGEVQSVGWVFGATGLPQGPHGESSDLFTVKGSKANAEVIGHSEYINGSSTMVGDTLRLSTGETIPLRPEDKPFPGMK